MGDTWYYLMRRGISSRGVWVEIYRDKPNVLHESVIGGPPLLDRTYELTEYYMTTWSAMHRVRRVGKKQNVEMKEIDEYGRCREAAEDCGDSVADDQAPKGDAKGGASKAADQGTHSGLINTEEAEAVARRLLYGLPVEHQDMPILAHRTARLLFDGTGKPFGSVFGKSTFGIDSEAACRCGRGLFDNLPDPKHQMIPWPDGTCGFYALPPDMESTHAGSSFVNLQVELYGKVIICDKGYRAGFQRVVECQIPACVYCRRKGEVLHVINGTLDEVTCKKHNWDFPDYIDGVAYIEIADGKKARYIQLTVDDLDLDVPVTRLGRD